MMNQETWERLEKAFKEDDKFDEEGWANDCDFDDMDLMDWLECSSTRPNRNMCDEFSRKGYRVYKVEGDSFGWLIGAVSNQNGRRITFG